MKSHTKNLGDNRSFLPDNSCRVNLEGSAARVTEGIDLQNTNINANRDVNIVVGSNNKSRDNLIKQMHTIADWVSLLNFHEVHKDVLEKVIPGTGTWMLGDPVFLKWVDRDDEALVGIGIPGAGKTCLTFIPSSVVIEHLKSLILPVNGPVAIAYVYCRYKDQLSTTQVLATLLRQLIEQSLDVLHYVDQGLYATCLKTRTTPRPSDLSKALQGAVQLFSRVFLVVDALDELEEQVCHDVIEILLSFHQSLFVTSRPIPLSNFSGLEIKLQAPSSDFQKIIEHQISHAPRLNWLLERSTLKNVLDKIVEKSQGMLLLASLQISSLKSRGVTNLKSLETTLNAMPASLNQLYEQILKRIATLNYEEQLLAHRAILWVTYAARFLQVDELLEILAIDLETATFDRQLCTREEILLSVCLGLLHIEQETRTIHLIHYTAQEFLQGHEVISSVKPHVFLADICAIYLSTRRLDFMTLKHSNDLQKIQAEHPFFKYATHYLGYHTTRACTTSQDRLPRHIEHLFLQQTTILHLHTIFGHEYIGHVNLIEFAAYYGLQHIFCDRDISISADICNSALFYACLGGQLTIVKKLLTEGEIDLGYQTLYGATFLHAAAERGHTEIAQLLIWQEDHYGNIVSSGIDVNAALEQGVTPLLMAAWEGNYDLAEVLLATPAINPNMKRWDGTTPLWAACQNRHESVVKLLLNTPGIDVNAKGKDSTTPLHIACENGHEVVAKYLLGTPSIDVNAKGKDSKTPLHIACENGHEVVIKYLLHTPSIDVNAKGKDSTTPLHIACENMHNSIVKLLLGINGIDINAKDRDGATPLWIACQNGDDSVVKLLLCIPGIDINAKGDYGATPLWVACQTGYESVVKLLLGTPGIDVNAKDEDDSPPLWVACGKGYDSVVKLLLGAPGIDINASDNESWTSLYVATYEGHLSIVQLLLNCSDIDVTIRTTHSCIDSPPGDTAIQAAKRMGHEDIFALFS